jgi:hypothetical protein
MHLRCRSTYPLRAYPLAVSEATKEQGSLSHRKSIKLCRLSLPPVCDYRRHFNIQHTPSLLRFRDPTLSVYANMAPEGRLKQLLHTLDSSRSSIGTLQLGSITYPIPSSTCPSRLARAGELLNVKDPFNLDNLHWMLQKFVLGQDIFLVSQPGPYARRLAMSFAR